MKISQTKLGIELSETGLFLFDPAVPSARIKVDQVIFDATRVSGTYAEGYVVAVHGLPQDIAQVLPVNALRSLGVGNHLTAHNARYRQGAERLSATAGDLSFQPATGGDRAPRAAARR